jgi:hypothetical protein
MDCFGLRFLRYRQIDYIKGMILHISNPRQKLHLQLSTHKRIWHLIKTSIYSFQVKNDECQENTPYENTEISSTGYLY